MSVEDELAIRRVLAEYCRGVDRRDWDLVRSCYHDDADEDHGVFRGSADDFVAWLRQRHSDADADAEPSMHFLGNVLVVVNGDQAFAESYAITIQGSTQLAMGGCRYIDRFERRSGDWRIASRTMTVEFLAPPSPAAPVPDAFTPSVRSADDTSYRVLAAVLGG